MRKSSSFVPASSGRDIERTYFDELGSTPRFDPARESALARAVVRSRRAYWAVLLAGEHLAAVIELIAAHGNDGDVLALAEAVGERLANGEDADPLLLALGTALDRVGDEHAAADAIVAFAAERCVGWHCAAIRTRDEYRRARNRFVAANLRLVVVFAQRHGRTMMALSDRIQEGNLGLMKAVDRFDPERGVRFSTYAAWWIRHAIVRSLANGAHSVRIPTQIQQLVGRAERTRRRLYIELGREPELREVAMAVDCDPERLLSAMRTVSTCSANVEVGTDEDGGIDALCDSESLAELEDVVDRRDRERAVAALAELPPRERDIVHERFALPGATAETFEEIGQRHGISRERARQVQRVALDRLRRKLEPRPALRPYGAA